MLCDSPEVKGRLNCSSAAQKFFCRCYEDLDPSLETMCVAHLDGDNHCIHLSRHDGDKVSAPFPLRSILRTAIELDTAGILLAHNHPSGDARPSRLDLAVTRRLSDLAEALGCTVFDHLIFAGGACTSFRSLGLL